MASWFTRTLDRITPWNRGGEVQRRQEATQRKKKRPEEQSYQAPGLRVTTAAPTQRINVSNQPVPQRPDNLFQDLNKALMPTNQPLKVATAAPKQELLMPDGRKVSDIPDTPETLVNRGLDQGKSWEDIARENNLDLNSVKEYSRTTRPDYGITIAKPKQGFGNRFRDVFDANTESDKYRRQEGNKKALAEGKPGEVKPLTLERSGNLISRTPVVGHVTKMLNTGAQQINELGFTAQQHFATSEYGAATEEYTKAVKSGDKGRIAKAKQRLDGAANRVQDINRLIDATKEGYKKNDGGLFNAGTLYDEEGARTGDIKTGFKDIALPTAVSALDIYTLGKGSAISQGFKQGGKAAFRTQAPNIIKATAGNYASGDLSARSEGATNEQAIKSGLINSILGIVPDVALPVLGRGFRNRILPKFARGGRVSADEVLDELDEAGLSVSAETANQALRPRPISVAKDIPVDLVEGLPENVSVRNLTQPKPLVQDVSGGARVATTNEAARESVINTRRAAAEKAFNEAPAPTPGRPIDGITPRAPEAPFRLDDKAVVTAQDKLIDDYAEMLRDLGEGNGTQLVPDGEGGYFRTSNNVRMGDTAGKRMSKAAWRDEAERQLRSGQGEPGIQKAFDESADPEVQALLSNGEQVPIGDGRPITVKQATGIPVRDETVVPTGLPENPGTVRAISATAPSNAKSAAVAAQMPTPILPKEVQEILDNPKQFNKRQVAAARNQRKMARAVAKANEETAEAMDRIETVSPAAQSGQGFVPTGEFDKGKGGTYQKVSRASELAQAVEETSQMSPGDVLQTARKNQGETGGFTKRDVRNVHALIETKRLVRGTPEWNEARAILKEDGTVWGQTGALRNYTMRRTASASELINRYESKIYRLADDPTKIDSKLFDEVEAAENTYTTARDDALNAYNQFTANPTSANAKLFHAAQDAADTADKNAKLVEYSAAERALKGNKDVKLTRELEKMADNADLYQMDAIDASMLSGTGTFIRNFVNAAVGGVEETIFGGAGSRVSRFLTKQNVGGGIGKGTVKGFGEGVSNLRDVAGARAKNAGKNPLKHLKNWATTGNQLGDTVIDSQVKHNVLDHYTGMLKEQGYKGRELTDRASVMARIDPDNLGREYAGAARVSAGLGSGVTRGNKFETFIKNIVSDAVSAGRPTALSEVTGKLVARMTVGFPTAIGRSTVEGVKRFTLGAPTFIKAMRETDPLKRSILIKEGIKQAGTGGLVLPPVFYAMGANGMITGAYPSDKEERARWEREGITENSIRIGDAYYQLPAYLGAWAVPGLFYASLGRNEGDWSAAAADSAKAIPALLPTDQASNVMDVVNGRTDLGKFMSQTGASTVRALTPAGALLNQISKALDPTKNDTTSGTNWENFIDKVVSGVPGQHAFSDIPAKEDDAGNPIQNPNALEVFAGAASAAQTKGEERSAQIQGQIDSSVRDLADLGAFDDPNLKAVLGEKELAIYDKLKSGEKVDEADIEKLEDALVKGVSSTGDDTAYLEKEQYDTNLTALKLKRRRLEADPTTKPSELKKMDTAIKRGEVYRTRQIPYDLISEYQTVGVEEWRKLGDPEEDEYDPDMYQRLWDIDKALTDAGASYRKGALDKQKYFAKEAGKGRGKGSRGGSRSFSAEFGTLKGGDFAPSVQQYEDIDQRSGTIPIIRTVRPNIVHKITSSG